MAEQFLGQIKIVPYSFAPYGWAMCNGQLLPISQYTALFSLLGTFYGGDGKSTFALPDFQGRVGRGQGQGPGLSYVYLGEEEGSEFITLTEQEIPSHVHRFKISTAAATSANPNAGTFALPDVDPRMRNLYGAGGGGFAAPGVLYPWGGGGPHENRQSFLTMQYIIALVGVYPSRG
jgi:microcystin-dependent protein